MTVTEAMHLSPVLRKAIRTARQNLDLTQHEAGAEAGISERTWRALENDAAYSPPLRFVRAAVRVVGLTPETLRAIGEHELAGLVSEDLKHIKEDPERLIARLPGSAKDRSIMLRFWRLLQGHDRDDAFVLDLLADLRRR